MLQAAAGGKLAATPVVAVHDAVLANPPACKTVSLLADKLLLACLSIIPA
jgi:hypothetical protein